jgi:flagellar hook-length control protein FliK
VPQAFSVSTSVSVVSAGPAAPSAAGPAPTQDKTAPTDFLGQLKTALKNLTKAVKQPVAETEPAPRLPTAAQGPAFDTPAASPTPKDSSPADDAKDALPDVLAALGFVPVPLAFAPPAPVLSAGTAHAGAAEPGPAAAAPLHAQLPHAAPADVTQPAAAAPEPLLELPKLPQPEAALPMPVLPSAPPLTALPHISTRAKTAPTEASPLLTSSAASAPAAPTPPTDSSAQALGAAIGIPQGQPVQHHAPVATGSAEVPPQAIAAAQQSAPQNFSGQGSADDRQQPNGPKTVERIDQTPSATPVTAAPDAAMAAATGATLASSPIALPPHVRPAEVVSQIAHQADLYRLPGNRGVRVQLHPEDLGGVEVTLRYGAGGALQLHINVEHAATGSLVQAGWSQLRDALATQGISPDRLIMSVTAPASSSQLDFSGGGSGRQTDPGMANFAQSQSGQQRQDNSEQTGPRGWNGAIESTAPSDDSPRVASPSAPTSRIDYRA